MHKRPPDFIRELITMILITIDHRSSPVSVIRPLDVRNCPSRKNENFIVSRVSNIIFVKWFVKKKRKNSELFETRLQIPKRRETIVGNVC